MQPTTLRLQRDVLDALDDEYAEYGYSDRSDYIRDIIAHRDPPYETTPTTADYDYATTADYERLQDFVDDLEARVAELERGRESEAADTPPTAAPEAVRSGVGEAAEDRSSASEPQGASGEDGVAEWVAEHGPVNRADIVEAFEAEWQERGIKPDSWWRRHGRPELEAAGAEFTRNVGWSIND